jgi:hypothetical protein
MGIYAGYTSIGNLQSMPIDILKVDKSFIDASNDGARGSELLEVSPTERLAGRGRLARFDCRAKLSHTHL